VDQPVPERDLFLLIIHPPPTLTPMYQHGATSENDKLQCTAFSLILSCLVSLGKGSMMQEEEEGYDEMKLLPLIILFIFNSIRSATHSHRVRSSISDTQQITARSFPRDWTR